MKKRRNLYHIVESFRAKGIDASEVEAVRARLDSEGSVVGVIKELADREFVGGDEVWKELVEFPNDYNANGAHYFTGAHPINQAARIVKRVVRGEIAYVPVDVVERLKAGVSCDKTYTHDESMSPEAYVLVGELIQWKKSFENTLAGCLTEKFQELLKRPVPNPLDYIPHYCKYAEATE